MDLSQSYTYIPTGTFPSWATTERGSALPKRQRSHGFTLVEVLVCLCILSLLALSAAPKIRVALVQSQLARAESDLRLIDEALERHYQDVGQYPNKLADLTKRGYLKQSTQFRSPLNKLPYFYAVDDNRDGAKPQQYALGHATQAMGKQHILPRSGPLPAGRDPTYRAWAWGQFNDLSNGFYLMNEAGTDTMPAPLTPASLSGYRSDLVTN